MIDPIVSSSVTFWLLAATFATGLLAPFWKGSKRADAHWLPLVALAASAAASWYKNKKANDAEKKAREQANTNTEAQDAAAQQFLAEMAANPDAFRRTTSTGTESGSSATSGSSSTRGSESSQTRQVVDPQTAAVNALVLQALEKKLAQPQQVTEGEKAAFARNANQTSEGARRAVENVAASRGLSGAQAGALAIPVEQGRTQAVLDFLANIPNVEREREAALRAEATGIVNARLGQDTNRKFNSVTNSDSMTNSSGSRFSSTLDPRNAALEWSIMKPGDKVSTDTGYSPWADAAGGAADVLGTWYANKDPKKPANPASDVFANWWGGPK